MRQNRVKKVMAEGKLAVGTYAALADPQIVEIIGLAGYDAAFIDMEHTGFDLPLVGEMIRAADPTRFIYPRYYAQRACWGQPVTFGAILRNWSKIGLGVNPGRRGRGPEAPGDQSCGPAWAWQAPWGRGI